MRLTHVNYDSSGVLRYPKQHDQAPESELGHYLEQARDLFASLSERPLEEGASPLSDDFEHLRWFELPAVCLDSVNARRA